jgi:uncharacterized protein
VRFVYVRRPDWYLSVGPGRDVIEEPITGDLDLTGWDLRKALGLLLKPNAALVEWLTSPVRYHWDERFAEPLREFAATTAFADPLRAHYLAYATSHWRAYIDGRDGVRLKKYFYVVRPALCLRWLRSDRSGTPPMHIGALMEGLDLPEALRREIEALIARKADLAEAGEIARIGALEAFVEDEIAAAAALPARSRPSLGLETADALLRQSVHGLWAAA